MADPQCDSISSMVKANWSMKTESGVSRKDPSKKDDLFCLLCRCKSGKNLSSQGWNSSSHFLRSSLLRVVSTLVFFWRRMHGCHRHGIVCIVLQ